MTWSELVLVWGMTLLLGGTLLVTPSLARPTLPLGVRVPADRVGEPVVRSALRAYRMAVLALTAVGLVAGTALVGTAPPVAVTVPVLLVTAGGLAAFVLARRPVLAAKAEHAWFAGKPVRMSAAVTDAPAGAPVAVGWYLAAFAVLGITTVIGASRYPELPERMPVHWGLSGAADAFAAKTPWTALSGVWVGWGLLAVLFVLAHVATRAPERVHPGDPPEQAMRRAGAQQRAGQRVLGTTTLVTTLLLCGLSLDSWVHPGQLRWGTALVAGFLVLFVAVVVDATLLYRRELRGADRPDGARAEVADDDRHWPGGLVYLNRDDPSVWVPKRVGIGWTINLGSPGGIGVAVGLLVLVALGAVLPFALGG